MHLPITPKELAYSSDWLMPTTALIVLGFPILVGVAVGCLELYNIFIWPFYVSKLRHLPGPKDNVFFLGQAHKFLYISWLPELFCRWSRQWPEAPFVRYLNFANTETLVVNNITAYKEILQIKASSFIKPDLARNFAHETIGDGLPFCEGLLHKQRRASLRKPFAPSQLRAFFPVVQAKARQLADVLGERRCYLGQVEVETSIWRAVLDIIGVETLGVDFNHLRTESSLLYEAFTKIMQPTFFGHFINYFNSCLPIRRYLPFKECRDHTRLTSAVRASIRDEVRARRFAMQIGELKTKDDGDSLQHMMEHSDAGWGEDEIVEYALNFLVLGHETTACAIIWSIHELSCRPELQQRLRNEVAGLYKTKPLPGYNDIEKLPFLSNFVRETLRLYCPVALAPRQATEDVEIAGVVLPKGTILQLSPAVMNLHPHIWGGTATQFDPDRWDNRTGSAASAYAFETFHNGPRMCLGRQLTMMEMKAFLVELVLRFQIESITGAKKLEVSGPTFTLRPKDRLCVRLAELDANQVAR